jgi:serine/threonine protein kinase
VNGRAPGEHARRLQRLWQAGRRPDLAAFLAGAGGLTPDQLLAVVRIDQQQRWLGGDRASAEDYLRSYPALQADAEGAVVLVLGEFLLRERLGDRPAAEEYLRRFPQYADALRMQFELHDGLLNEPPTEEAPAASEWPGVPGFELVRELGRGATSTVFQVRQADPGRVAALKLVRGDLDIRREERSRFRIEGEAAARLGHPNVVQIFQVGEWQRRPYLVLEYVAGGSLRERLEGGPLPVAEAVRLAEVLARALHHAHERGVIHRDLHPANVLLTADGTPKLTDFGLAKVLAGGAGLTRSWAVLGTPAYMAPEQAEGKSRQVGPATDVHGLGAVLYHMLAGRPPYDGGDLIGTLSRVRSGEMPPAIRPIRSEVPAAVEAICLRCLAKRPADRYRSALELAEALAQVIAAPGVPHSGWPGSSAASPRDREPGSNGAKPRQPKQQPPKDWPPNEGAIPPNNDPSCAAEIPAPDGPYLRADAGACYPLTRPVTVIGRSPDCDLRLHAPSVSRQHCRIVWEGGGAVVEDLDSTQGTWVNGQRVRSAPLADGDRLEIGGRAFRFHSGNPEPPSPNRP